LHPSAWQRFRVFPDLEICADIRNAFERLSIIHPLDQTHILGYRQPFLCDRHVDAGAALSIDQLDGLRQRGPRLVLANFRSLRYRLITPTHWLAAGGGNGHCARSPAGCGSGSSCSSTAPRSRMSKNPPQALHFQKCSASLNGGPRVTFPMICRRRIGGIMFAILVIG